MTRNLLHFKPSARQVLQALKEGMCEVWSFFMQFAHTDLGRGRTSAFGVYIGHKICHRMLATSATLLSRPDITMSEGPKDQTSRCPASKQVISCLMALK